MKFFLFVIIVAAIVSFLEARLSHSDYITDEWTLYSNGTDMPISLQPIKNAEDAWTDDTSQRQLADGVIHRIVGGTIAEEGRYEYFVQNYRSDYRCGGMLIAEDVVLTAAHCTGYYHVSLGMYHVFDSIGSKKDNIDYIDVKEDVSHPDYDRSTLSYDFKLLFLKGPSRKRPICLANERETFARGENLHVIGFGSKEHKQNSLELREAKVKYISNRQCGKRLKNSSSIFNNMMCADSSKKGRDACQGDSGGPLLKKRNGHDDVVVGVVSWGIGCGRHPGVYGRISSVIPWIEGEMEKRGRALRTDCRHECSPYDRADFVVAEGVVCKDLRKNPGLAERYCSDVEVQGRCPVACACAVQGGRRRLGSGRGKLACEPRDEDDFELKAGKRRSCSKWVATQPWLRCTDEALTKCPVTCACFN